MIKKGVFLLLKCVTGLVFLVSFNLLSPHTGLYMGVNPVNASLLGVFGVSGFALILMLQVLAI